MVHHGGVLLKISELRWLLQNISGNLIENTCHIGHQVVPLRLDMARRDKSFGKISAEIYGYMSKGALVEALNIPKKVEKRAALSDLLRTAIMKSSLGVYNGSFYYFNGRLYEKLLWSDLYNITYEILKKVSGNAADVMSQHEKMMRVVTQAIFCNELEQRNSLVVFENGIYDVERKVFHREGKASRDMVCFSAVPYRFSKGAVPVLWQSFLDDVLPDRELQYTLQEFLGAIFIDRSQFRIETMMILLGSGANGKSVVFQTIMNVLGRENVSNFGVHAFMGRDMETKLNVAHINGKRLNYCPDMKSFGASKNEDAIKALISGEPMSARNLYSSQFMAHDIPLFMANCNELPSMKQFTSALKRRLIVIPFDVTIPLALQNHKLASELETELPAIFNWIMEGRDRFVANGCSFSSEHLGNMYIEAAMMNKDTGADEFVRFIRSVGWETTMPSIRATNHKWLTPRYIQMEFSKFAKKNNIKVVPTWQQIGRKMRRLGFTKKKTKVGSAWKVYKFDGWREDKLKTIDLGNGNIFKEEEG